MSSFVTINKSHYLNKKYIIEVTKSTTQQMSASRTKTQYNLTIVCDKPNERGSKTSQYLACFDSEEERDQFLKTILT